MSVSYTVDLWDSLTPPSDITSEFGDIVLVIHTKGSTGAPVTVTAPGWESGVPASSGGNPQMLWRQDLGQGMTFTPSVTNPDGVAVRWAVVRIQGADRQVGDVKLGRASPPGIWDFVSAAVEDAPMLLAVITMATPGVDANVSVQVTNNLLTEPTFVRPGGPLAGIVRTLRPHVDFSVSSPIGGFSFGVSGNIFARGQSLVFVATWGDPLPRPAPPLDSPVTVRFSESLNGVFADPTIEASFFQLVDLPVGSRYELGDQLSGEAWYAFDIRDRSRSRGLITYAGETLIGKLNRLTPRESLILVAGQGGVPAQLDLRECLRRFLVFYGVPFVDDLPAFYLRAGDEIVAPLVDAFVIQPDQENPESIYVLLERFFGPFRGYTFRADAQDRLVVTPPAWVDTIGLRLTVYRRRQELDREPTRPEARAPWSTTRRPVVEWQGTVDGVPYTGALPTPLERAAAPQEAQLGPLTVRLAWDSSDRVYARVWPIPPSDTSVGSLYSVTFTIRPESLPGDTEALHLTNDDLNPDEVESTSAESVINQAIVPVRRRSFQTDQQVMQAGALVLRSPGGVMAGAFGANQPFGPLAEELETPSGFLELVNDTVETGTWFWPVEEGVVSQPGGDITVAFEVDEWAEQWREPAGPHLPAAQVNSFADTVTLPANGAEVRLFDFQFPRQTSNFAPGAYGARGSVYGRWRAGDQPGVELRVGNSRFVEFGYLAEFGPFGQTVYFLWGAVVKLNGTGTTFTTGELETYRFGFSRGDDGLWEGGANVPALTESQALYPDRVFTAPELPYEVSPATALAIARGIVEENLTPKTVYSLPLAPARERGWVVRPHHLGRAATVLAPGLNLSGRVVSVEYDEAHTPLGSSSGVTVEVELAQAPAGSRAASHKFGRAAYGVSHYQQEDD